MKDSYSDIQIFRYSDKRALDFRALPVVQDSEPVEKDRYESSPNEGQGSTSLKQVWKNHS